MPPDFVFEDAHPGPVAGLDEAGRGPWAGPVVAAAVILDRARVPSGLNDSKQLSRKRREALFELLSASADIGVGIGTVEEIAAHNIARATDLAMLRATRTLRTRPGFVLVDGRVVPSGLDYPARAIIGGDAKSLSVAAASIVAKVTRDRIMRELATAHPGYGWEKNVGYGTADHRVALERLGLTPHHRLGFRPMRNM